MREPRVHTGQALECGRGLTLEPEASRHLLRVLRLGPGARIRLFNGDGREFAARLTGVEGATAVAEVQRQLHDEEAPALALNLYLGISKGERMDLAVQKAVELGVTSIQPLFTARSVVQLKGERLDRRHRHWHGIAISACEQSGRCRLPRLLDPANLASALMLSSDADCRLLLHPGDGAASLDRIRPARSGVDLLIGPEGGLTPDEVELALSRGFLALRLGPRILRTETAPLAALAAIQAMWGDFRG